MYEGAAFADRDCHHTGPGQDAEVRSRGMEEFPSRMKAGGQERGWQQLGRRRNRCQQEHGRRPEMEALSRPARAR